MRITKVWDMDFAYKAFTLGEQVRIRILVMQVGLVLI